MAPQDPLIELPNLATAVPGAQNGPGSPLRSEVHSTGPFGVEGTIPEDLDGVVVWIGPNPIWISDPTASGRHHNDGMVHSLAIDQGRPTEVRSRFIRTRHAVDAFGFTAPSGPLDAAGPMANQQIVQIANRLIALDGRGLGYRITTELATVCVEDFDATLGTPMGTHVVTDPWRGGGAFLGWDRSGPPHVRYHEVNNDGVVTHTTAIPITQVTAEPAFGASATTVAVIESSAWDPSSDPTAQPDPLERGNADHVPHVGLLIRGRPGRDMLWCASEPGHTVSVCAVRDTEAGMDLVVLRRTLSTPSSSHPHPDLGPASLDRLVVNATTRQVSIEPIDTTSLAQVASDLLTPMEHRRFAYGIAGDQRTILKYNLYSGVIDRHELAGDARGDALVFVRDPHAKSDEAGWLIVTCVESTSSSSAIHILDTTSFTAPARGIISLATRLPGGLSGLFVPRRLVG